jgi:nucleotidyltransferase/DNA polymerase involved in DNA repair
VGVRLEERLKRLGVSNPHEINNLSDNDLQNEFGPFLSKELRLIGKGERSFILDRKDEHETMQSVGRSITGYKLENNEWVIKRTIMNLIDEACFKLRKMGLSGRSVSIYLMGDGKVWYDHFTLKYYVRHSDEVYDLLYNKLYKKWKRNFRIIKYGIRISHLKKVEDIQPTIFKDFYRKESLYKAIDSVSEKYGLNTLHSGVISANEYIRPEVTGFMGDKKFLFGKE